MLEKNDPTPASGLEMEGPVFEGAELVFALLEDGAGLEEVGATCMIEGPLTSPGSMTGFFEFELFFVATFQLELGAEAFKLAGAPDEPATDVAGSLIPASR